MQEFPNGTTMMTDPCLIVSQTWVEGDWQIAKAKSALVYNAHVIAKSANAALDTYTSENPGAHILQTLTDMGSIEVVLWLGLCIFDLGCIRGTGSLQTIPSRELACLRAKGPSPGLVFCLD